MPGAPPRWMKTVARSQTGHSQGFVVFPIRCAFSGQFLMPRSSPRWMKTVARSQTGHSQGFVVFPIRCAFSGQALNAMKEQVPAWPRDSSLDARCHEKLGANPLRTCPERSEGMTDIAQSDRRLKASFRPIVFSATDSPARPGTWPPRSPAAYRPARCARRPPRSRRSAPGRR